MAVTVLVVWMFTLGAGLSLLVTSKPSARSPAPEPRTVRRRREDPFAPPSLRRARSEPLPGLRSLLEFTHPGLAITGFGLWTGYVVSRNDVMAIIACCVLGSTVAAGLTWFISNARRGVAGSFSGRLASTHGAFATITLLLAVLVVATR